MWAIEIGIGRYVDCKNRSVPKYEIAFAVKIWFDLMGLEKFILKWFKACLPVRFCSVLWECDLALFCLGKRFGNGFLDLPRFS